jgi:peptide/nickel transport system substrate-binding protein
VTVKVLSDADYFAQLNNHELPFFIHDWYSWGNDPAFQFSFLLQCGVFTNYTDYCNERIDQLIEEVTWSVDEAKRETLMREAQQIIAEEAPWVLLYQPDWIVGVSPDFTGVTKIDELTLRFAHMGKKQQ